MQRLLLALALVTCSGFGLQETRTPIEPLQPVQAVRSIHGSVLLKRNGEPIAALPVRLVQAGVELASVLTDEAGHFEFSRVPETEDPIAVLAGQVPGIRIFKPYRQALLPSTSPLHFLAFRAPTAVLRGHAVRKDNGQALAGARVKIVERFGPSEVCTTDAQGHFVTTAEYRSGGLRVLSWDNAGRQATSSVGDDYVLWQGPSFEGPGSPLRWEVTDSGEPVLIELPVGPRIELDVRLPEGTPIESFQVVIKSHEQAFTDYDLSRSQTTVHAGRYPWVRVRDGGQQILGKWLYLLAPEQQGIWCAELPGEFNEPLHLEPMPFGSIVGELSESSATPGRTLGEGQLHPPRPPAHVKAGLRLDFERLDGNEGPHQTFSYHARINQPFRMLCVPSGLWRVVGSSDFYPEVLGRIYVPTGGEAALRMTLGVPRTTGTLRIRIVDRSGDVAPWSCRRDAPDYTAEVRRTGSHSSHRIRTHLRCGSLTGVRFKRTLRDGRWVLEAKLSNVPEGEYTVHCQSKQRSIEPSTMTVPHDGVAIFELLPRDAP